MDCICFNLLIGKQAGDVTEELEKVEDINVLDEHDKIQVKEDDDGEKHLYRSTGRTCSFFLDSLSIEVRLSARSEIFNLNFENNDKSHVWEWIDKTKGWEMCTTDIDGNELQPLPVSVVLPVLISDFDEGSNDAEKVLINDLKLLQDDEGLSALLLYRE